MSDSKSGDEDETAREAARARLGATGRNEACPCGSGKKYKKCHLQGDEQSANPPAAEPNAQDLIESGWRLFEQRRPGAAEKEFRAALALEPGLAEALVGIGMARLQAGDNDGARRELSEVVKLSEGTAAQLARDGVKDAFSRKEAQAYIRASHALGCLAYDQERYDEALEALGRVYSVDDGTVGTEARLIAAKTLMKLARPPDAIAVLEAASPTAAGSRAQLGLALAHFAAGERPRAEEALDRALAANPHFGKALLGQVRKRMDNPVGAAPGSREEALVYAQTYGDVWDAEAKKFLEETLAARDGKPRPAVDLAAPAADAAETPAQPGDPGTVAAAE
jgi:tetratricopeptide (TPR) repeat protein